MQNFDLSDVIAAHRTSSNHREILSESEQCGCFFCLNIFVYQSIDEWWDDETTAVCPSCGIDSVIGSASGFPMTQEFLKAMQAYYFNLSAK